MVDKDANRTDEHPPFSYSLYRSICFRYDRRIEGSIIKDPMLYITII
ncbi:hypothetical protein [Pseudogracilibacillus auburnensis]|nr:hypothetical protein [Pseudogracilibacillus auburnensis]MBO1003649.1 hypothetical protein [Pseudogracilibacillus auburnensis]